MVRLGVDRLIVVGAGSAGPAAAADPALHEVAAHLRPGAGARALHLGAHLEGSWAGESEPVPDVDAAVQILAAELTEGDVVLVKASRSVGLDRVAAGLKAARGGAA